ncbi:MAG TPA: glycosyltransferase family 4 protein, partial [Gammaproteobacteria bacterium]|nr:glycosyltransferase family 4 protein [Gammaproteobacteria bacterium]
WEHEAAPGSLIWESRSLGRLYVPALAGYPYYLLHRLRKFAPDIIIGASDIPHVALAAWLTKRLGVPYAADLYDNFEGFGQARIPGMVLALRRSVRSAGLVTTTSEPLRKLVLEIYRARGDVVAMPSSIDKAMFYPRDRFTCRTVLGLPVDARLIGTAGGLHADKGITILYEAWQKLEADHPNLHLVLAGPTDDRIPLPVGPRVHYLGALPHDQIPQLFCALDVGIMCIPDTPFGRYCFPQKAYEMLACNLPVVTAELGAMKTLFASMPQCLYRVGDGRHLAMQVLAQLANPVVPTVEITDWQDLIAGLERHLRSLMAA